MAKILIIEDEADVRANLIDLLELEDYEVLEAENGLIGIEIARKELPDLILSDIMMPHKNGYEVLLDLQKDPHTQSIPFIDIPQPVFS